MMMIMMTLTPEGAHWIAVFEDGYVIHISIIVVLCRLFCCEIK